MKNYTVPLLPLSYDFGTEAIFKKLILARSALAELKGVTGIVPNQSILIDTLSLQEAKDSSLGAEDPLIKMAIIHHQFESIHPFYDGNGRTGRIVNVLYLVKSGLLDTPVLYLSRYINHNKADYYRLLQDVRDKQVWTDWVVFMLEAVIQTAQQTTLLIQGK